MDYEQKLDALQGCVGKGNVIVDMDEPGNWGVSMKGAILYGSGKILSCSQPDPQEAVEAAWQSVAQGTIVVNNDHKRNKKRAYQWNGYRWAEVTIPTEGQGAVL